MTELKNTYKGVNEVYRTPTEYNGILTHDNITSLNNFIRYGHYYPRHEHVSTKNKSIADLLLLNETEINILYNYIEIMRINFELITGEPLPEDTDDEFIKLLVSIDKAPTVLPMFYQLDNLVEDIFYYDLLYGLFNWIIVYEKYCKEHGVNEIQAKGIVDLVLFNSHINTIKRKLVNYLVKSKVILESIGRDVPDLPFGPHDPDDDDPTNPDDGDNPSGGDDPSEDNPTVDPTNPDDGDDSSEDNPTVDPTNPDDNPSEDNPTVDPTNNDDPTLDNEDNTGEHTTEEEPVVEDPTNNE